jgi:hypothetical protein
MSFGAPFLSDALSLSGGGKKDAWNWCLPWGDFHTFHGVEPTI